LLFDDAWQRFGGQAVTFLCREIDGNKSTRVHEVLQAVKEDRDYLVEFARSNEFDQCRLCGGCTRQPWWRRRLVGALSLILIAVGAPALGALYARTENFSLAFGLLGAFALLVFWLTSLIREEETAVR